MPAVEENFKPIKPKNNPICSPIPPARSKPDTAAAALTATLPFKRIKYKVDARGRYCYVGPGSGFYPSIKKIALIHYVTKSSLDFQAKMARHSDRSKQKKWDYFDDMAR